MSHLFNAGAIPPTIHFCSIDIALASRVAITFRKFQSKLFTTVAIGTLERRFAVALARPGVANEAVGAS